MSGHKRQRGAVSLFIVIFSAILMTVITLSFIRLMLQDQQQASDSDLSQSAYDSAISGVEDAKRAILKQQTVCGASPSSSACATLTAAMASQKCTTLSDMGIAGVTSTTTGGNKEVLIKSIDGSGVSMNQAYTCVKIALNTPDYLGTLKAGESNIIPLSTLDTDNVHSIELSWFTYDDFSSTVPSAGRQVSLESNPTMPLYAAGGSTTNTWPKNRPSLVRAQLMQFSDTSGFKLGDFDGGGGGGSDANTLFLYPAGAGATSTSFAADTRGDAANSPQPVTCNTTLTTALYACKMTITLPDPVKGGVSSHRTAYLRLSALYTGMHYTIKLINNAGNYVDFNGVQPSVDSTGRANDLFRRVQSRIELTSSFPYPEAAVDVTGGLCKTFIVTDRADDYDPGACGSTDEGGTVVPPAGGSTVEADFVQCPSASCPAPSPVGGGPTPTIGWSAQFQNTSNNDPTTIDHCTWDFGDDAMGDPNPVVTNDACNYLQTINHTFYPNTPTPPATCETYTVTLTVYLKSGLQKQKTLTTKMPWGSASPCK